MSWSPLQISDSLSSSDYYFDSKAHHSAYTDIINDDIVTGSIRKAILANKISFRDNKVLIVSAGISLLPFWCHEAGASEIIVHSEYPILSELENSILKSNNVENIKIVVTQNIEDLPIEPNSVDIIISESVYGCFLFYESKIDRFLKARDLYLKKETGILMPSKLRMMASGIAEYNDREDREKKFEKFWGLNLSLLEKASKREPYIGEVDARTLVTNCAEVFTMNLLTVPAEVVNVVPAVGEFDLKIYDKSVNMGGICFWFEVYYEMLHTPVVWFTTSPESKYTVFKQTTLQFDQPISWEEETMTVKIAIRKAPNEKRELQFKLGYANNKTEFYRLP
jgi:type I protein arginine methyltransferase